MAPEILDKEMYNAKADAWSVGAISLEMIVGSRGWAGAKGIARARKAFFLDFADGKIDLAKYGVSISPVLLSFI